MVTFSPSKAALRVQIPLSAPEGLTVKLSLKAQKIISIIFLDFWLIAISFEINS